MLQSPTLAVFADPGDFADNESYRRALLMVLAHEIIGRMLRIVCSAARKGRDYDSIGYREVAEPAQLQRWVQNLADHM